MKKILTILLTLVLFLSLAACGNDNNDAGNDNNGDNNGDVSGDQGNNGGNTGDQGNNGGNTGDQGNNGGNTGDQGNTGDSVANEQAFKAFLAANKMPTVAELDEAYAELVNSVKIPENIIPNDFVIKPAKATMTEGISSGNTADVYLFQKDDVVFLSALPEGGTAEDVETIYLDLAFLEEAYDESIVNSDFESMKQMSLSQIVNLLLDEMMHSGDVNGGEVQDSIEPVAEETVPALDLATILAALSVTGDDFTVVENGKFQLKNDVLYSKVASLSGGSLTVEYIKEFFNEQKITLDVYAYYDNNAFKGFEVNYDIEVEEGVVMEANVKLSLSYTNNVLSGINLIADATDTFEINVDLSAANGGVVLDVDADIVNMAKIEIDFAASASGLELHAKLINPNQTMPIKSYSFDFVVNEEGLNAYVKTNEIEIFKLEIEASTQNVAGKEILTINGSLAISELIVDDNSVSAKPMGTITMSIQSQDDLVIPDFIESVTVEDAESIIDLIMSSGNGPENIWARDLYFESYVEGDVNITVGDVDNGIIVDSNWVTLYIDGKGNGEIYQQDADPMYFSFNVEDYEAGKVADVKLEGAPDFVTSTIEQAGEKVILKNYCYEGDTLVGTQVYTFTPYYMDVE